MKKIRTLIVDDEKWGRKAVRVLLEDEGNFEIVGECSDGLKAIEDINNLQPDLVFLDIQMPEISGIDVVEAISKQHMPHFIFATAYDQHAIKAFDLCALDYLLKPFSKTRFQKALIKVKERLATQEEDSLQESIALLVQQLGEERDKTPIERIAVKDSKGHKIVNVEDIEWIKGADYYVNIHCEGATYLHRERLKRLEEILPSGQFFRIHKSAIINLSKVKRLTTEGRNHLVVMASGASVPVSSSKVKALMEKL